MLLAQISSPLLRAVPHLLWPQPRALNPQAAPEGTEDLVECTQGLVIEVKAFSLTDII